MEKLGIGSNEQIASEILYHYMAASMASQLPYIEGSDEETKGIIKIKRKTGNAQQLDTKDEVNTSTRSINTSSYGLTAEEVNINMDNITQEYKIAWISDLHMMQPNEPNINTDWYTKHSTTFEKRNAGFNNSYSILPKIIECLNGNDFDAIVFGGDIMDNYSETNFKYLKEQINRLTNKNIMFLVADHDYLTEMTTNSEVNKSASSLGVSGDIKKITIGKNGDAITLVGQNYSNEQISESSINTIGNYFSEANNSLFFTHVPVESKTQADEMQNWSKRVHNDQVYYWSKDASSSSYNNPSSDYLNTLYNSTSLKGVFAGHVHSSGDFELNTGIKEHIFQSSFNNSIGVITLTPSGNVGDRQGSESSNETTDKDLTYIGYKKFQDMLKTENNVEKDKMMDYFSLDESWNLCIAKPYKKTVDDSLEEYTISEVKIPYKTIIADYGMNFDFLMDLQLVTQNAFYVYAVTDLARNDSKIDLTIFDNYEIETDVDIDHHDDSTTSKTVTVTETDTIKANVTKAKTWILDQTTSYSYNENTVKEDDDGDKLEERKWEKQETIGEIAPSKFMGLWQNKYGYYVRGADFVSTSEKGKYARYPKINDTINVISRYQNAGTIEALEIEDFLNMMIGIDARVDATIQNLFTDEERKGLMTDPILTNILTSEAWLCELLESNPVTQQDAEIMRYLIKIYRTGKPINEYTGEKLLVSVYEPTEFIEGISYAIQGGIDVHDESLFITDVETLKKAFSAYSGSSKLIQNAQAFLNMQSTYKVNAIFGATVSIIETSGGRAGNAVNGCNNWFNIRGKNGWANYGSDHEGIEAFGNLIANGKYYYTQGKYTVDTIGYTYCPNTSSYPTQGDKWIANVTAQMVAFYNAVGKDISSSVIENPTNITNSVVPSDLKDLFPNGLPNSEAEMRPYLVTVKIPVNDKSGKATTKSLTVHKAVANSVVEIFKEIQASGFKAYSVGAYTWRSAAASSSRSHHSYGVAIDINPNENYMIKNGKIIAGSLWNPGSNEYSIGTNSAVVKAFNRHGWTWGGVWKSSKDYMHFSLTGR